MLRAGQRATEQEVGGGSGRPGGLRKDGAGGPAPEESWGLRHRSCRRARTVSITPDRNL